MTELIERRILIALIYSKLFLAQVVGFFRYEFLKTNEARKIARIAIKAYKQYGNPIGDEILTGNYDEHTREIVEGFVDTITEDEKKINVDVLVDETVEYFKQRSFENLATDIEMAISAGKTEQAENVLKKYKPVSKDVVLAVDPMDLEVVQEAFEFSDEQTVKYSGHLGRLLNDLLVRDGFVALMAPEKRGKTWFLVDLAMRAYKQKLKIAFFEVGDMSRRQILRRFYSWLVKRPVGWWDEKEVKIPVLNCKKHLDNSCNLEIRERDKSVCTACLKLKYKHTKFFPVVEVKTKTEKIAKVEDVQKKIVEFQSKLNKGKFKLSVHSSKSLSVSGINDILKLWQETENFVPDVVVIDYADILLDEGSGEYRHRVNETWANLRKLSQDWHCLVFTATQSDVKGHNAEYLTQMNFSEDKRKMAHVTGMIGLSQLEADREKNLYKFNIIVAREKDYRVGELVAVGYSFDIGRPVLFSYFE